MKRLTTLVAAMVMALSAAAQTEGYYTKYFNDQQLIEKAEAWKANREWAGTFTKASADESVNAADFYLQYQKNKAQWDKLFKWLEETDLLAIPKGKHPIEGAGITVSVEDSENQPLEKRRSESHHHKCDFMLVVKGVERFGILDHNTSTPNCAYQPDVIHYDYDKAKLHFIDSKTDRFVIFFPNDWHIAKVANDTKDQKIRVIVAKVDYVE